MNQLSSTKFDCQVQNYWYVYNPLSCGNSCFTGSLAAKWGHCSWLLNLQVTISHINHEWMRPILLKYKSCHNLNIEYCPRSWPGHCLEKIGPWPWHCIWETSLSRILALTMCWDTSLSWTLALTISWETSFLNCHMSLWSQNKHHYWIHIKTQFQMTYN